MAVDLPRYVIVIDSDLSIHALIKSYFNLLRVKNVVSFTNPSEAISSLKTLQPDLLFVDAKMRMPTGDWLFSYIAEQETYRGIPVVAMFGLLTSSDLDHAQSRAMTSCMVKPFTEDVFRTVVGRFFSSARPRKRSNKKVSTLQTISGDAPPPSGSDLMIVNEPPRNTQATIEQLETLADSQLDQDMIDSLAKGSRGQLFVDKGPDTDKGRDLRVISKEKADKGSLQFIRNDVGLTFSNDLDEELNGSATEAPINLLHMSNILVVEGDASQRLLAESTLRKTGIPRVDTASSGEGAWQHIQRTYYDLIILDWKARNPHALGLYNRMRRRVDTAQIPIIITCGYASREDFRIIEDNPATLILEKPLNPHNIKRAVTQLMRQINEFQQTIALTSNAIQDAMIEKKSVLSAVEAVLRERQTSKPILTLLAAADYLLAIDKFDEAEKILTAALQVETNNVHALTLMGKLYYRTQRNDEAYAILLRAQIKSPQNIERLCSLGEVGLSINEPEKAEDHFKKALAIDGEDPVAKAGLILTENLSAYLGSHHGRFEISHKLASVLNLVAITMIRSKNFDGGINQYRAAMAFALDDLTKARLEFNLGLANLRAYKFDEARQWFKRANAKRSSGFHRAEEFLAKIDAFAIASKQSLEQANEILNLDHVEEEALITDIRAVS